MTQDPDIPDETARGPWTLLDKEPTTLIALWPGDTAPTQTEVLAAMKAHAGDGLGDGEEVESEDDRVLWVRALDIKGLPETVLVWA